MSKFTDNFCEVVPRSCDTFAVLPPGTNGYVVFGKNSDRPNGEVQEVIYASATDHPEGSQLKCTYIEIEQVRHTHAVILSKPSWMWGVEMGANEHGVCIGNEAVWTRLGGPSDLTERLLGMDLVRLGLERSSTALEAVNVISALLEKYGQGGNCSDIIPDFTYHNSFLIADPTEVWILETAERFWVAQKITRGVINISNELSIGTDIDLMSSDLFQYAKDKGLWHDRDGPLNFKKSFGFYGDDGDEDYRYICGKRLLTKLSASRSFSELDMFKVLRDESSGICMKSGSFLTTGSQVSVLQTKESGKPSCHWFTATVDPSISVFKPFVFASGIEQIPYVISPNANAPPGADVDRQHELHILHKKYQKSGVHAADARRKKSELENKLIEKVERLCEQHPPEVVELRCLFKNAVEEEMQLYGHDCSTSATDLK